MTAHSYLRPQMRLRERYQEISGRILRSSFSRWVPWIRSGTYALTDQALISTSNFLLSVLLARWLGSVEYGVYALAFAVYLFLLGCFQALVIEPISVFGAAEYSERFDVYLGILLRLQAVLSIATFAFFGLAVVVCELIAPLRPAAGVVLGLAVGCPLLLTFFLLRITAYITGRSAAAVRAAILYCLTVLVLLFAGQAAGHMTAGIVFLIMGLASAAASGWLLRSLKPVWSGAEFGLAYVAKENWDFGRWELARIGSDWICQNSAYLFAGGLLGVGEVGELKALTTLFLPLNQTVTALRRIFLPHLSRKFRQIGHGSTRDSVRTVAFVYAFGAVCYGLVLWVGARWLVPLLYGNKFGAIVGLVPWFALSLVFSIPVYALDMGLRAVRLPKAIFFSSVMAAVAQVVVAWPLTRLFGLRGLIMTSLVTSAIFLTSMIRNLRSPQLSSVAATPANRFSSAPLSELTEATDDASN